MQLYISLRASEPEILQISTFQNLELEPTSPATHCRHQRSPKEKAVTLALRDLGNGDLGFWASRDRVQGLGLRLRGLGFIEKFACKFRV